MQYIVFTDVTCEDFWDTCCHLRVLSGRRKQCAHGTERLFPHGVIMPMCAIFGCASRSKSSAQKTNTEPGVGLHCLPKVIARQCERTKLLSEKRRRAI